MTLLPCAVRKRTESSIMRRFSSRLTRSTLVRCRPQVLPTTATVPAKQSASTRRFSSSAAATPLRVVIPKATSSALLRRSRSMRRKNSISLGFDAGKPPSMKWMPSSSSLSAMRTFSSTETDMPSCCMPSRRVVSYSCTLCSSNGSSPRRGAVTASAFHGLHEVRELLVTSLDDGVELLLDATRQRPGLADEVVVDLADRHDLGGRAGEEELVGEHHVAARKRALADLDAHAPGDPHDAVAGDAFEDPVAGGRRQEHTVAHREDVLARALGHVTVLVEHDRLVVPTACDLHLGADAAPDALLAEVGAPRPHGDDRIHGRVHREDAHLPVPAEDQRADVAGLQAVGADHLVRGAHEFLEAVRHRHVVELRRALETPQMLAEAEHGRPFDGLVAADAFEDARAVVERVREDVDLGLAPGHKRAVHPDLLHLSYGHRSSLPACQPAARAARMASVISAVPSFFSPGAAMSAVRAPCSRAVSTALSTARAASRSPKLRSSIMAALRMVAHGLASPLPAISGAEPWIGSYRLTPPAPTLADGSIPMLPVSMAASSLSTSPNRFSVAITSNCLGSRMNCMAQLSTSMWRSSTSGWRSATRIATASTCSW